MNEKQPFVTSVFPKPQQIHQWGNITSSTLALSICDALQHTDSPIVLITNTSHECDLLMEELNFFLPEDAPPCYHFPDWETLPYDHFSPHQDVISERLGILNALAKTKCFILVISITTLIHRFPPVSFLKGFSFTLKEKDLIDTEKLKKELVHAGYTFTQQVYEHGEFSIRGAMIDLFPMGSPQPFRIELFDDEVESIRTFHPETQRSIEKISEIRLLPAHEFPFHKEALRAFKNRFLDTFNVNVRECPLLLDLEQGVFHAGIEYYAPLFFDQTATFFDYLPKKTLIFHQHNTQEAITNFWEEIQRQYENHRYDKTRPALLPQQLFLAHNECFHAMNDFGRVTLHPKPITANATHHFNAQTEAVTFAVTDEKPEQVWLKFKHWLGTTHQQKQQVLIAAESMGRRESLSDHLKTHGISHTFFDHWQAFCERPEKVGITVGTLGQAFCWKNAHIIVLPESALLGRATIARRKKRTEADHSELIVRSLTELKLGDPIIHFDHGVGRYRGLQLLTIEGKQHEFVAIEYAKQAKLYVPVSSLHLISRYAGFDVDSAPLHQLGHDEWQKEKKKAQEKAYDMATELLEIYAKRKAQQTENYPLDEQAYQQFSDQFRFEETIDQQNAIQAVVKDLQSTQPMDRLICGDVGFGKTEVAMRACFIAAYHGKQVAILVPTTLLAEQHYESFCDRFAGWPFKIAVLSRFKSAKEQEKILSELKTGHIDIVIGTHKLLQDSVSFKKLGLIVVDEEHRFGVRHKEQLNKMRGNLPILTLTATPIPRTLNMAVSGLRDISIIATPPQRRLSIKTFVKEYSQPLIKEAITRELLRGGQVYIIHNEIESIEKRSQELQLLVPEARVAFAHGQMPERALERIMSDFYHKKTTVLVCTTIVETGIDIPSANTMIIERADRFGLAQLHQLRGRVGRSHHQAYAYLITPPIKTLSTDAQKRLEAIQSAQDLGAGFTLATHDMEIRGAGTLLGEEQSGHMHTVGFSLYLEMLETAVQSIREGKQVEWNQPLNHGCEVNLHVAAIIPEAYLFDIHERLIMYKRISAAKNIESLSTIKEEIIDRFGLLPQNVQYLFKTTELKLKAQKLKLTKIELSSKGGFVDFSEDTPIHPMTIIQMVQKKPEAFRFEKGKRLKILSAHEQEAARFSYIEELISALSKDLSPQARS